MESLADVTVDPEAASDAIATTAVIKLNGGLGTSMGMDRAKSLLCVRRGLSFLDIIARQVLHLREEYDARLPLIFMNSFRTSADTMAALARYDDLPVDGLPLEFLQNKEPKLLAKDLAPVSWPKDPDLEWCPPGHGDIYTALLGTGLLDQLIDAGYTRVFVSNSDNLGAVPDATRGRLVRAVRCAVRDRGGPPYRQRPQGRPLRPPQERRPDHPARDGADAPRGPRRPRRPRAAPLHQHQQPLVRPARDEARPGRAGRRARPAADPQHQARSTPPIPATPEVIQIETAMGAAIEVFEDARTIEVGRDRFVPVKTTDDLLVLRSDVYDIGQDFVLDQAGDEVPYVGLDPAIYKLVGEFDKRFPEGAPSLREADPPHRRGRLDLRPAASDQGRGLARQAAVRPADPRRTGARCR